MTGRELLKVLEHAGALDYELLMNVNLEPIPVDKALVIHDMQLNYGTLKDIVILDNR